VDDGASARPNWSLQGTIGKLTNGHLSGTVDVAHPNRGLHCNEFDHENIPCTLLGVMRSAESLASDAAKKEGDTVCWPLPVADAYVRGNDLVASFLPVEIWPYSPQLDWQANPLELVEGVQASLSLLVSVQTHLLDTWPQISVFSQVPSNEVLHLSMGEKGKADVEPVDVEKTIKPSGTVCCAIWRLPAVPFSYVEIMSTSDFRKIGFTPASNRKSFAEWHLFADFLEKGVIRRARVHSALLPRENDVELAIECCAAIEQSPLPLTT
jgi:hypothetical protein